MKIKDKCELLNHSRNYFTRMKKDNPEMYEYIIGLHKSSVVAYRMFQKEYDTIKNFLADKHIENEYIFRQVAKNTGVYKRGWSRAFIQYLFVENNIYSWKSFKKRKAMYEYYKKEQEWK